MSEVVEEITGVMIKDEDASMPGEEEEIVIPYDVAQPQNEVMLDSSEVETSQADLMAEANANANLIEENKKLKKDMVFLQEKFNTIHSQVQNQAKLIELLIRLDLIKSTDDPNSKELEDLHRKISMCYSLIEECGVRYNELCTEKRRSLLGTTGESEKRSAIWDHFTVLVDARGEKNAECNYCHKMYPHKSLTPARCREHLHDKCDKVPQTIRQATAKPQRTENTSRLKGSIWSHFNQVMGQAKPAYRCKYCNSGYTSRNATKCREHLAFKCPNVSEEVQNELRCTFSQDYIAHVQAAKRSTIWEHFNIISEEENKTTIQCIYCCINYANKNATKCREHLLERCEKIPLEVKHKINNYFYDTPLKTWTQVKIPIWKHFTVTTFDDRKQYKCNYCEKLYSSKNVTKFRGHLLTKCDKISEEVKDDLAQEINKTFGLRSDELMPESFGLSLKSLTRDAEEDEEGMDETYEADNTEDYDEAALAAATAAAAAAAEGEEPMSVIYLPGSSGTTTVAEIYEAGPSGVVIGTNGEIVEVDNDHGQPGSKEDEPGSSRKAEGDMAKESSDSAKTRKRSLRVQLQQTSVKQGPSSKKSKPSTAE